MGLDLRTDMMKLIVSFASLLTRLKNKENSSGVINEDSILRGYDAASRADRSPTF